MNAGRNHLIREHALTCLAAGISVIPVRADGSKRPAVPSWQPYQHTRAEAQLVESWFHHGEGLAVIGGAVSGNLEILDFDDRDTYHAYKEAALAVGLGDLIARIEHGYLEESPKGMHWPYRCEAIAGNTPLARRPSMDEHGQQTLTTLIETRGEGGYAIIAPSNGKVHPSGKPYVLLSGSIATIATITPQEREELFRLARTFDETIKAEGPKAEQRTQETKVGERPGDLFNARATWGEVLEPQGWTKVYMRGGVDYWRRPGKSTGVSATTNYAGSDLLYVFSTSTLFESERGYSKFSAYALVNHNGDFSAAAQALAAAGYRTGNRRAKGESRKAGKEAPLSDEAEKVCMAAEERLDQSEEREEYPCPALLWRGRFAQVADRLGKHTWEVWVGTLCALAARAHRNLHFTYHRALYGMVYALLVNPTGTGKGLCPDVCRALLPKGYTVRDAVQSGPALAPILAEIERDRKGKAEHVTPRPAILVIEEWTTLIKNSNIEHSTLQETLNSLFQRPWSWNVTRSDRPGAGGDLVIQDPTLTICASTTESLLREHVSERMIRSGALNRYLVLPGTRGTWPFYDPIRSWGGG